MGIRRDLRVANRRQDVAELYLAGRTQAQIAQKWGVTQQTVSLDLRHIHAVWVANASINFGEAKARELARIDRLEREYWSAWERSVGTHEKRMRESADGKEREQITSEELVGDSRFLDGVRWCIEQRLKIFGVYAAQKFEMSWREAAARDGLTEEQANRLYADMVAAARTRLAEAGGGGSLDRSEAAGQAEHSET